MTSLLIILSIIVGILLILIVVIQNPKGGGIAANFSSGNQYMGVAKTNDLVEKATWTLAGALLVLALISSFTLSSYTGPSSGKSALQDKIEQGEIELTQPNQGQPEAQPATPEEGQ